MTEENHQASIEERLDRAATRAAEWYERNTVLRAMVVSIPYLGGGLDTIITSEAQRATTERVYMLLDELSRRMKQHDEEAINREYLDSDEFIDLVIKAFDAATKTRDEEKIRWYARILTESTVREKQGNYFPEEYLHLIADLTPLELRVANHLYKSGLHERARLFPDDEVWTDWKEQVCNDLNIDRATLPMNLSRIAATGLIEPVITGIDEVGNLVHWGSEPGDPSYYGITAAFQKLMKFLELRGQEH
jgi:hypothetical protein